MANPYRNDDVLTCPYCSEDVKYIETSLGDGYYWKHRHDTGARTIYRLECPVRGYGEPDFVAWIHEKVREIENRPRPGDAVTTPDGLTGRVVMLYEQDGHRRSGHRMCSVSILPEEATNWEILERDYPQNELRRVGYWPDTKVV